MSAGVCVHITDGHSAFVKRFPDGCAVVTVYARPGGKTDFSREVERYETLSGGATNSARRAIRKLEGN